MNNILEVAIESGLKFPVQNITNYNVIPDSTFGIFVGIERSTAHTLPSWPINIHGCIGYWDPKYRVMNKKSIIEKIIDVARDATWQDDRRKYFPHSIYIDLHAKYKIYFMLEPIHKINYQTGMIDDLNEIFDNNKYGLIVESDNHRATYLPEVFINQSWNYIKKSLINKAGIVSTNNITFYAYDCESVSMTLADYFITPIQNFINEYYKNFIPYSVTNNKIIIDKTENVRNLATIYDILQMEKYGYELSDNVKDAIMNNLLYYKTKYLQDPSRMRQSSAFLMLDLYVTNPNDELIDVIKSNLYQELKTINNIEPNFELGEILMCLTIVESKKNKILEKILAEIPIHDEQHKSTEIDIFRWNWRSKLVGVIKDDNYKYFLVDKIFEYIGQYPNFTETNYYAVEFESLATLYGYIDDIDYQKRIEKFIASVLINLQNRKNKYGLYEFTNGDIRLDITGHILNGFYNLISLSL